MEYWSTRGRTCRTCRTSRTGGVVCRVPLDNNKTSRVCPRKKQRSLAYWSTRGRTGQTGRTSRTGHLVCRVPLDNKKHCSLKKNRRQAEKKKKLPHACRANSPATGATASDTVPEPRCNSRRDDRAMMTKKERGDVNSRSRASPLF